MALETSVTALFVPGNRPDRFAKAAAAGADVVIIDLEDAVAPAARASALAHVVEGLAPGTGLHALVRVTAVGSPSHASEVEALRTLAGRPGHGLAGLLLPKADDPEAVDALGAWFGCAVPLVLLIESAAGVQAVAQLARRPGVVRLAFGALDFSLDVDADVASDTVAHARSAVVIASRAAGIAAPLDTPSVEITDLAAVSATARASRRQGFGGLLCIHPAQVAVVHEAFRPTAEERRWAANVVAAGEDATQVDGRMVDRPVLERARRILSAFADVGLSVGDAGLQRVSEGEADPHR